MSSRISRIACMAVLALLVASEKAAQAVVFRSDIPAVTMTQMKTQVDCTVDWPVQEFGLVYQGCHQLYGRIDFERGAKTLRRLTLVARDFASPQNVIARLMRKKISDPAATFTAPEMLVEVSTGAPVDALKKISAAVPAAKGRVELDNYFYYVEVYMDGPTEFAGVVVEYSN